MENNQNFNSELEKALEALTALLLKNNFKDQYQKFSKILENFSSSKSLSAEMSKVSQIYEIVLGNESLILEALSLSEIELSKLIQDKVNKTKACSVSPNSQNLVNRWWE